MAFEQRDMSGSMFKNDDKDKEGANPDWPDRKGQAMIGGVMYWVSGWLKTTKGGQPWLSLAFKVKNPSVQQPAAAPTAAPNPTDPGQPSLTDPDFEIPF